MSTLDLCNSTHGFLRLACIVPELRLAEPAFNAAKILQALEDAAGQGAQLAVLPELCLTGYSCQDLFFQPLLQEAALQALGDLAKRSAQLPLAFLVGLPLDVQGRLYNCAAFVQGGRVHGLVPKTYLPNGGEFYEQRWFRSARDLTLFSVPLLGQDTPIGAGLLFQAATMPLCRVGVELCEDLWAVQPPSGAQALAGATVLCNLSASNELLGKAAYRLDLVRQQSGRCLAAYAYCSAGPWESTTDIVYSGQALIAENGVLLAASERFSFSTQLLLTDVDLQRLQHHRQENSAFGQAPVRDFRVLEFHLPLPAGNTELLTTVPPQPFVPADLTRRAEHCEEIFSIQATALARRLLHTGAGIRRLLLGVSGGLDSTLALLVCCRACDLLQRPRSQVLCVGMPGFGTSERTRGNAAKLAAMLGADFREIPIQEAVALHFQDIGHDPACHDLTFENAQARERTQLLMDLANKEQGLVVGTGDLSEAALGWCTFNGDHMSMYHVNAGVPKTMVRYVITWCAEELFKDEAARVLRDIVDTPISPELLPPEDCAGGMQDTEAVIGPYELHDFFLFHVLRTGAPPRKVLFLARQAFGERYDHETLLRWLRVFYRRFFMQQFKRSSMPDGPKVGTVALSPRGDWRMPSDAVQALWLRELEPLEEGGGGV